MLVKCSHKRKYSEKIVPHCHSVHHKSHTDWSGVKTGILSKSEKRTSCFIQHRFYRNIQKKLD